MVSFLVCPTADPEIHAAPTFDIENMFIYLYLLYSSRITSNIFLPISLIVTPFVKFTFKTIIKTQPSEHTLAISPNLFLAHHLSSPTCESTFNFCIVTPMLKSIKPGFILESLRDQHKQSSNPH